MTNQPQPDLFAPRPELPRPPASEAFGGATYDPPRDYVRLTGQLLAVFNLMRDGQWRTLAEIKAAGVPGSDSSISARVRDFRKNEYGGHKVESRCRAGTAGCVWEYRLIVNRSET
jgi:hypothetical protein